MPSRLVTVLEWGRRRARADVGPRPLDALASGGLHQAQVTTGLNAAWLEGVSSFYDLLHGEAGPRACGATACTFEGRAGATGSDKAECLGRCYEAPAHQARAPKPIPRMSLLSQPVALREVLGHVSAEDEYRLPGGEAILDAIFASGLQGRGGAAYPTGLKWKAARQTPALDRYVVANGDEGDPGSFVDRLLLEESPHAVLAGMKACALAVGASRLIVFIRGEYAHAADVVRDAASEASSRGWLPGLTVTVLSGAGSYVAGEETALLRSIEGLRAEPSPKPPYPAVSGLHGLPTVVQNVETLAMVPWVVRNRQRADVKVVCLSGAIARPGAVEIALGTPLRRVLDEAGGGPPQGRAWKMALVGGPMGRVLRADEFDAPLSYKDLPGLGHGGVVLLDERVSARALAEHLFQFAAAESCGTCTPCRVGTAQLARISDPKVFERLLVTLEEGSLCGFGQGVPRPLRDLIRLFPGEVCP